MKGVIGLNTEEDQLRILRKEGGEGSFRWTLGALIDFHFSVID